MGSFINRIPAILLIVLLSTAVLRAEGVNFPDLGAGVSGADGVTYLDLARQVVPDLAAANDAYEGHKVIGVRRIGGDGMDVAPPDTVSLYNAAVLPIQADGKDRLLMLLDLGQAADSAEGFAVLALYNLAGAPKLLDAANVSYDRLTYFRDPAAVPLGEGKHLALTVSMHFNSNQSYATTAMILLRNDRLQLVDTVFTFSDRSCSFEREQLPEFRAGDRDARTYSDLVATVTESTKLTGQPCEGEDTPVQGTRKIAVTYHWDEASSRFVPDSDAFEKLAKDNENRF